MTGFGGGGGFWVKKSLVQPLTSSPADRASAARASRGMGLGPALGSVAGEAAASEIRRHADAEMRTRILAVHDLDRATVGGHELQHDGEPDAGALDRGALGGPAGIEGLEDVI